MAGMVLLSVPVHGEKSIRQGSARFACSFFPVDGRAGVI